MEISQLDHEYLEGRYEIMNKMLSDNHSGYFLQDTWSVNDIPLPDYMSEDQRTRYTRWKKSNRSILFNDLPDIITLELKYVFMSNFHNKKWTIGTLFESYGNFPGTLRRIVSHHNLKLTSFCDITISDWNQLVQKYRSNLGLKEYTEKYESEQFSVTHERLKPTLKKSDTISDLKNIYYFLFDFYDPRSEFDKDIINLRKVGARIKDSVKGNCYLDLRGITVPWLRKSFVDLLKVRISGVSPEWAQNKRGALVYLSRYIVKENQNITGPNQINRELIKGFVRFISTIQLERRSSLSEIGDQISADSRYQILLGLKKIITECNHYKIGNFPNKELFRPVDFPRIPKSTKVKWIEEAVVVKLKSNSDKLPSPHKEILLVMLALGTRPTDTVTLGFNCLDESKGVPTITRFDVKTQKEAIVPVIDQELLSILRDAQERARSLCGNNPQLLFPTDSRGKCLSLSALRANINALIRNFGICGSNEKLWRFNIYQCRHTFATDLLNAGADLNSVRVALNHDSFRSINKYAKVRDNTLKEKWALANGYQVDITGKIIEVKSEIDSADSVDKQWLKANIMKRALPNGYCYRKADQPICETGNKCIHCSSFRTCTQFRDVLAAQLEVAEANIVEGKIEGSDRMVCINNSDASRLKTLLGRLDQIAHMEAGHA